MDRRKLLSGFLGTGWDQKKGDTPRLLYSEEPSLAPYDGPWNSATAGHLLRRALVGPTWSELQEGAAGTMSELVEKLITPVDTLPGPSRFVGEWLNASALGWDGNRFDVTETFNDELRRWWYLLMANNGTSVRERMTLFWHNHFATSNKLMLDARYVYYQNQLFRKNALGNFKDLVRAVTLDKAMLLWLNGRDNKNNGRINENFARELQELFTIGIADNNGTPNYSQGDIVEAARALSGWDWIGFGTQGDVVSNFLTGHDASNKSVYGESITGTAEGGPELNKLLDIIFSQEETGRYLIRKLYRFFVHTDVPMTPVYRIDPLIEEKIIAPLALEFRQSNWDIATVLRRLFSSKHFYDSEIIACTIKSPADFFVGILRSTAQLPLTGDPGDFATQYVQDRAETLGQNLFFPPGVQGWGFHRSWISTTTLPQRHRYSDELILGAKTRITDRLNPIISGPIVRNGTYAIDLLAYAKGFSSFNIPRDLVKDIATHLLAWPPSPALLDRLRKELTNDRDYEWEPAPDAIKATKLQSMMRYLMRTTNYQLL